MGAVEKGWITLIGATTENPSFEVISALLSRCQVYVLNPFGKKELQQLLDRAIKEDSVIKEKEIVLKETDALFKFSGGDARKLLNIFELLLASFTEKKITITNQLVQEKILQNPALYDKGGDQHYDIISAFIKSIRGSDPNGAVYWLARMLEGGEDIKFIARRMVILASEDIGNANPTALIMATNTFQSVSIIGMPESRIILSQCAIYLATSPKSNSMRERLSRLAHTIRGIVNHGMYVRYHHDVVGVNSRLDSIQAAVLSAKLPLLNFYNERRKEAAIRYTERLGSHSNLITPYREADCDSHVFHQYTLRVIDADRDALVKHLNALEIPCGVYYPIPLHLQKAYADSRYNENDFQVTNQLVQEVISLPMHTELELDQIDYICSQIITFLNSK